MRTPHACIVKMPSRISAAVATLTIISIALVASTGSALTTVGSTAASTARHVFASSSVAFALKSRVPSCASTRLFHSPSSTPPPKHDVGNGNQMSSLPPDQLARVQAFMEHQQNAPKIGFPTDVRSLVQYNHGFAVMSTNSKS